MATLAPVLRIRGRAAEIAVLGEALDRVASGRPAVVLIEGEAGIGKTRLLDEALADARSRGMQVAAGRAEELEQTRPFGLVAERVRVRPVVPGSAAGGHRGGCWRPGATGRGARSR